MTSDNSISALRGASEKNCRPISCVKIDSGSIGDIIFLIRALLGADFGIGKPRYNLRLGKALFRSQIPPYVSQNLPNVRKMNLE